MRQDQAIALAQRYARHAQGIVYIYSDYLIFDGENYSKSGTSDYEVSRAIPRSTDGKLWAFVKPSGTVVLQDRKNSDIYRGE